MSAGGPWWALGRFNAAAAKTEARAIAATSAATVSGTSQPEARPPQDRGALGRDGCRGVTGSGGEFHHGRGGAEGVRQPARGAGKVVVMHGHRVSFSASASVARPRAAVDLTVPGEGGERGQHLAALLGQQCGFLDR